MENKKTAKTYFKDEQFLAGFGNKLREFRISKGLSIEKLAHKSEIAYSQLSRIELGKVNFRVSFIPKIASALKINAEDLIP